MTNRNFVTLEDEIAPSVPGCPQPVILQYVRRSAIESCERTLAWRYYQESQTLTAGVYEYEYETPSTSEVCGVIHAALNDAELHRYPQEEIHRRYPDWPSTDATKRSTPLMLGQFDPDHYIVAPVPDGTTYTLNMFLALRPTPDATYMDKTAFDELEDIITHGALQHMLVLPNKSWTDRELANYHAKQFTFKIAARRAKANLGVSRGSIHAKQVRFA